MFRFLTIFIQFSQSPSVSACHALFSTTRSSRVVLLHPTTCGGGCCCCCYRCRPEAASRLALHSEGQQSGSQPQIKCLDAGGGVGGGGLAVETTFAPTLWKSETVITQSGFQSSNSLRCRVRGERFFPPGEILMAFIPDFNVSLVSLSRQARWLSSPARFMNVGSHQTTEANY